MRRALRRGAVVILASGACVLILGVLVHIAGTARTGAAAQAAQAARERETRERETRDRDDRDGEDGNGKSGELDGSAELAVDPALFSPGACMSYAPTKGDRHQAVFLDAGHGGIDPGAVGTTESGATVTESAVNLAVELDTMAILRGQGYRVVVSRTEDTTVTKLTSGDTSDGLLTTQGALNDVAARAQCADLGKADVLVGIYMDSGEPWNAGSVTAYDADRPFSAANLRLATLVQDDVLSALNAQGYGIPDEGVLSDTGLGSALTSAALAYGHLVLLGPAKPGYLETPSQMPGALIEPLFLTDPFEASIAASTHGQQVIAAGLAKAVDQYFVSS